MKITAKKMSPAKKMPGACLQVTSGTTLAPMQFKASGSPTYLL